MKRTGRLLGLILPIALGAALLWPPSLKVLLESLFPGVPEVVYPRSSLLRLTAQHLVLTLVSGAAAALAGTAAGIAVTRGAGRDFLPLTRSLAALAQTFPPVAVIALMVPLVGYGAEPVLLALFLYSILPVLNNTIAGLENVPPSVREAARGMGMKESQVLGLVELPLAGPVIFGGIRTAVTINVGTATLGAVAGAGGLGNPIVGGLVRDNPAFVLEGAAAAGLLALGLDRLLDALGRRLFPER